MERECGHIICTDGFEGASFVQRGVRKLQAEWKAIGHRESRLLEPESE